MAAAGPGRLVVLKGERTGRKIMLEFDEAVIGRAIDCDVRFDNAHLSRKHALIKRISPVEYEVTDLGSSNGTFINGVMIEAPSLLKLGDKLRLGNDVVTQLTIHDPVEEQLLHRQRLETLGRLGAGIAHDFNNMLGAVLSNLEYMGSLPDGTALGENDTRDCLLDMRAAALRAAELSQRLVAFARGESQTDAIIDVSAVCEEVAQLVRRTFDRSINVKTDIAKRLRVSGESLELHQVLMNLCLNARDAMPSGGTLSIQAGREDKSKVVVIVSDTGQGIDKATLRQIFEPFFTTKQGTGFGLGLATVRDIISALDGTVSVDSSVGQGSAFRIELPFCSRRAHRRITSTITSKDEIAVGQPLSILLVDDEDMVARSIKRVLELAGHELTIAASGQEAIEIFRRADHRPDVVLLDVDMPDMNGEQTLRALLAIDRNVKVIMVSGHRELDRELQLRAAGARHFVRKPWEPGELLLAIESLSSVPSSNDGGRPTSF